MNKRCTKCGEEKELGEFHKNKKTKDGLNGWCKDCKAKHERKAREAMKERFAKRQPLTEKQMSMMKKTCPRCKEAKTFISFGADNSHKDGLVCWCRDCVNEYARYEYHANREKHRMRKVAWRKKNPREALERSRRAREKACRFKLSLITSRNSAKRAGYFPCDATVDELKAAFSGKCEACGVPEIECSGKLHMDHNHSCETQNFRGFLCSKCNKALGLLGDSEDVIVNMLHYLMNGVKQQK